jgi:YbbR domain-containing protein
MRTWLLDNLGLKLLSVFLAVFLWAVVLGEQKVEVTVNIPLELNLPHNLVLANDPPDTLEVHLRGPKTLVTTLAAREVVLNSVPTKFVEGENIITIQRDTIRVPRGIEVQEVNPRRIRLVMEALVEREVEVKPHLEGAPAEGFAVRAVTTSPARVKIVGPRSELRRLTQVSTLPIRLDGQAASFSIRVMLEPLGQQIRFQGDTPITAQVEIGPKRS